MKIEYTYESEKNQSEPQPVGSFKQTVRVPKDLPAECQKHLIDYFHERPVSEIRAASDFLSSLSYYLREKAADNITMEDFEKEKVDEDDSTEEETY